LVTRDRRRSGEEKEDQVHPQQEGGGEEETNIKVVLNKKETSQWEKIKKS
jgi:hypothetical protein